MAGHFLPGDRGDVVEYLKDVAFGDTAAQRYGTADRVAAAQALATFDLADATADVSKSIDDAAEKLHQLAVEVGGIGLTMSQQG